MILFLADFNLLFSQKYEINLILAMYKKYIQPKHNKNLIFG